MNEKKKKILLITTKHTGCGHKSISDSLMDWFVEMPEVEVVQVDGFEDLVNRSVTALGDSYGAVSYTHLLGPTMGSAIWWTGRAWRRR